MAEFFSSGLVAVFVLVFMVIEGILIAVIFKRTGTGIAPRDLVCSLAAGGGLVLALFAALTGANWYWIAMALVLSLVGHGCDVWRRWRYSSHRKH